MGMNINKDNFGKFLAPKLVITINSKKYDINGNAIFNINVELVSSNETIKNDISKVCLNDNLLSLTTQNKKLKNNTINIKEYKSIMIDRITKLIDYDYSSVEVIDNT